MRVFSLACLVIVLLTGCSASMGKLSRDEGRKAPVVYIHPLKNVYTQARVAVLPFQVPDGRQRLFGEQVAALFRDVMLGKRAFPVVKLVDQQYGNQSDAARIGKEMGADLVLAGRVNYVVSGTELGGARVDVSIRLLNTSTGNTVWYVRQTCEHPWDYPDNSFVSRLVSSMMVENPRKPLQGKALPELLARVAVDMTDVMAGYRYLN